MKTTWVAAFVCGVGASGAGAQPTDFARAYEAELRADAAEQLSAQAVGPSGPKVGGYLQFRYVINRRDNVPPTVPPAPAGEDLTVGFQDAKIKLTVAGNVTEDFSYSLLTNARLSDGTIELQDAVVNWKANENWTIRWGQFKLPLLREELMMDTRQLAVDRSAMNSEFTQGRSQLVQAGYSAEKVRFFLAFSDGLNTLNTDFNSPAEADYAFTGRCDWMFAGADWARFNDFTSWRGSAFTGMVGGAAHWQSGGETDNTIDSDLLEVTADASLEGAGWSAFAEFVFRSTDPAVGTDADDMGFLVQGGIFVAEAWELFARYDGVFPDSGTGDDFNTITAGVNYYVIPESHAAKFSLDFQYFIDAQATSIVAPNTLVGLLPSAEEGQWVMRLQAQLNF
jgi:hypothetical protein